MAKGFKCDKCKTWHEGEPTKLTSSFNVEVKTSDGRLEFMGKITIELRPTTWRGEDFCYINCISDAIVDILTQHINRIKERKELEVVHGTNAAGS